MFWWWGYTESGTVKKCPPVKVVFRQASRQGRDQRDQLNSGWSEVRLKGSCCSRAAFMQRGLQIYEKL